MWNIENKMTDTNEDIKIIRNYCASRKTCLECNMYKNCWKMPYKWKSRNTGEIEKSIRNIKKMCDKSCWDCKYGDTIVERCLFECDPGDWNF